MNILLVIISESINRSNKLTYRNQPSPFESPGPDWASALWWSTAFLSVSNWFLINNCNQSWAFTPSSPLTVGANPEGCEYFWAHSPHAACYHEPKALSTNHMKGHEWCIVTISKLTQTEPSEKVGWILLFLCSWLSSQHPTPFKFLELQKIFSHRLSEYCILDMLLCSTRVNWRLYQV